MRMTVFIDGKLMKDALQATGCKTKREVVQQALQTLIRLRAQADLRGYRGKLHWQGNAPGKLPSP